MARISRYYLLAHSVLWMDGRRVVSGIAHVIRNSLQYHVMDRSGRNIGSLKPGYHSSHLMFSGQAHIY
jgi:hypothetical protein